MNLKVLIAVIVQAIGVFMHASSTVVDNVFTGGFSTKVSDIQYPTVPHASLEVDAPCFA